MSDREHKEGLATALDATHGAEPPSDAGEQPLLPMPLKAATPEPIDQAPPRSGPGRKPGSRNRRTQEWIDYLAAKGHRMPLEVLAEIWSRSAAELAEELGCKQMEAFERQMQALVAALPYLHQRQPMAVDVSAAGLVQLVIGAVDGGDAVPTANDGGFELNLTATEAEPEDAAKSGT